ncbi:MAG: LysR family transcriptional regulator [Bacteroidales bacterium]
MVIQQLEYIVALDRHRHFVKASEECGVSQPTLSAMIQKLEIELDIKIFDRDKHPIEPTAIGKKIIQQATTTLNDLNRIFEIVKSEVNMLSGKLQIGIIPTVSPYLIPDYISLFKSNYSEVDLSITEMRSEAIIEKITNASLDIGIVTSPINSTDVLTIPLYKEKFVAYFSDKSSNKDQPLTLSNISKEKLWVLREGHCEQKSLFNACEQSELGENSYEAGSIETLIRIVDKNNGYTIIPELHKMLLNENQLINIREISEPVAEREISLIIRKDYVKERMLNAVIDTIKSIIPEHMLNDRIKKFSIRL